MGLYYPSFCRGIRSRSISTVFFTETSGDARTGQILSALASDLERYAVLKLAQREDGTALGRTRYLTLIRSFFAHPQLYRSDAHFLLPAVVDQELKDEKLMVVEEALDWPGDNLHLRIRAIAGARPASEWSGTLETFVKFYSPEKEAEARLENALSHYTGTACALPVLNRTALLPLPEALVINGRGPFTSALVMPFSEMKTLSQCLEAEEVSRSDALDLALELAHTFHLAIPNAGLLNVVEAKLEQSVLSPAQRQLMKDEINTLRDHFYLPQGSARMKNHLQDLERFMDPQDAIANIYRDELRAPQFLNANGFAYLSSVHGDLHSRNLFYSAPDGFFVLDFGEAHLVAPQIDLARLLTSRGVECSWEEQQAYLERYLAGREPTPIGALLGKEETEIDYHGLFLAGYDAAMVRNTLRHLRYVADHRAEYGDNLNGTLETDYARLEFHAEQLKAGTAKSLREAVKQEFNLS